MKGLLFAALAAAGCYVPGTAANCELSCANDLECPDGLRCGQSGVCSSDNACAGDVPGDGSVDGSQELCFGHFYQPCLAPGAPIPSLSGDLDTDNDPRCTVLAQPSSGPPACAIVTTGSLVVAVRAHGKRPLVLIADTITITRLDVSSTVAENGAGACTVAGATTAGKTIIPTGAGLVVGSGGAGGSNGGKGGSGGTVTTADGTFLGGAPLAPTAVPTFAVGGCPGGDGGKTDLNVAAVGGRGGGAVFALARTKIQVLGSINASGSGGRGSPRARGGGGGGGAGGLIVLDAPTVELTTTSKLLASGGGGGAGQSTADQQAASGGDPAIDLDSPSLVLGHGGGATGTGAGSGGNGSGMTAGTVIGDNGGAGSTAGSGGGGGGAGRILYFAATLDDRSVLAIPTPQHSQ